MSKHSFGQNHKSPLKFMSPVYCWAERKHIQMDSISTIKPIGIYEPCPFLGSEKVKTYQMDSINMPKKSNRTFVVFELKISALPLYLRTERKVNQN